MPGLPFRPVQGLEKTILGLGYAEGHVYFATDTGKLYMDVDGIRKPLGGSGAAVMYSSATSVTERADGTYNMAWGDLDDEFAVPKVDDLIINPDGRFFRVLKADQESGVINCSLIAVSGTGGGGGGTGPGPGPGGETSAGVKLEAIDTVPTTFIYGQSYILRFRATATNDNQVYITYTIQSDISGNQVLPARIVRSGEIDEIDIGKLLPAESGLAIRVDATSDNDGSASPLIYRYRSSIQLLLRPSNNFNPRDVFRGAIDFECIPVGAQLSKTLYIYVDDSLRSDLTWTGTSSEAAVSVKIEALSHGIHTLRAVLSTGQGLNEIFAPALEYEIACDSGENVPLIWTDKSNPTSIINHDRLALRYMVYNPAENPTQVGFWMQGVQIPNSPLSISYDANNWNTWNVIGYKVGQNLLNITCGSSNKVITIDVAEDTMRDMDIVQNGLHLSLSSTGRSNRENRTSRQTWSFTNANEETISANLQNFNWYNNGWIDDGTGETCLRISNGAKVSIPLSIMNTDQLQTGLTFEVMFKLRNVQSYKTLITTESTETESGDVIIEKQIHDNESVFAKYYNNSIGFCLGTQEAFFCTKNKAIVSGRYKEDELITISFALERPSASNRPLIYMYINGIMSAIITYDRNSDSFLSRAAAIEFVSDYCDIDLYKVRVYKSTLSSIQIVQNYIADKQDTELYDMNQIVSFENNIPSIDYNRLLEYNRNYPDNPTLPYAVLEVVDDANNDLLPFVKGGKVKCNVTFVNPSLDIAYNNGEVPDEKYITSCPSFTAKGASFDVQGTSSQGYPRRNYKGKFKDCGDTWVYTNGPLKDKPFLQKNEFNGKTYKKYYMDNTQGSESTFTWKTDYMDSSAVHNTGFASFVKTMYSKHPLTDILPDKYTTENTSELRTTIYGFPMIVFQLHQDGRYEFIGRYNFNLDKGCNDVIGFERDDEHPYVKGKTIAEVAECWEFCDNQGTRCSFKKVDFDETNEKGELTVNDNFEYRYSYFEDQIDECLDGEGDFASQSQQQRNAYMLERFANLKKVCEWINSTDTQAATNLSLPEPVTYNGKQYDNDTAEYRLAKFTNEFSKHLDLHYCSIYFIMTELLLCYDSRGKNMMFATWGPHEKGGEYIWYPIFYDIDTQLGVNNSGVPTWDYDINATADGQFSTSNSVLWNNFWNCFRTNIISTYNQLRKGPLTFENLNGYYSFDPKVSGSYAMMGCRPINIMNVDEYFKYIAPTFTGFTNTLGQTGYDNGAHFYCLQGTRELQRELFLRNRFNFIDSGWTAGTYDITQAKNMKFRYNANASGTSDTFLDSSQLEEAPDGYTLAEYPQSLDTTANWSVTPYLKQSVSMYFDEVLQPTTPIPYKGEGSVEIAPIQGILDSIKKDTNFTQQLVYFGGIQYISSFGDLSLKYLDEITLGEAIRLKDLVIGNDTPGFYNSKLNDNNFELGAESTNENKKTLLEKVVLTGLSSLRRMINVSGSEKLKEFRALGTNITGVTFAEGTQIEVLHLPQTITDIELIEPTALTNILTEGATGLKDEDGNWKPGIYIDNITNKKKESLTKDDSSAVTKYHIVGGNMGYDSYKLLDLLVAIKQKMLEKEQSGESLNGMDTTLKIRLEDVMWSPYRQVASGESIIPGTTYVKKTDHYTFENYTPGSKWENDIMNGRIYAVDNEMMKEVDTITSLDLLDTLIASYDSGFSDIQQFPDINQNADGSPTLAMITGDIFINNSEEEPISEDQIKNHYIDKYYKDLHIYAKYVDKAYVARFVEILDSGVEQEWDTHRYNRAQTTHPEGSKVIPVKLHYDFVGWVDKPNASESDIISDWSKYTFSERQDTFTFYAVYKIHSYNIEFRNGQETLGTTQIPYNQPLTEWNEVPYMDDTQLANEECYAFVGWTEDSTRAGLIENTAFLVDINNLFSTRDYVFYACFQQKSVFENICPDKYLNFTTSVAWSDPSQNSMYDMTGITVYLKSNVKYRGKLTLPAYHDGQPIIGIGVIGGGSSRETGDITHIFFEAKDNIRFIASSAFQGMNKLVYIDWPTNLRKLENNAFSRASMYPINDTYNLAQIGDGAFNQTGRDREGTGETFHIGNELDKIGSNSISYMGNRFENGELVIGEPGVPMKLTKIGNNAIFLANQPLKKVTVYTVPGRHEEVQSWIDNEKITVARGQYELSIVDV